MDRLKIKYKIQWFESNQKQIMGRKLSLKEKFFTQLSPLTALPDLRSSNRKWQFYCLGLPEKLKIERETLESKEP